MARSDNDWNFYRIHSAHGQIASVQVDMMRCLHNGKVTVDVRARMVAQLRNAADELRMLNTGHETESENQ